MAMLPSSRLTLWLRNSASGSLRAGGPHAQQEKQDRRTEQILNDDRRHAWIPGCSIAGTSGRKERVRSRRLPSAVSARRAASEMAWYRSSDSA